ncbi:MAG: metallopeptidase family protein [Chthoniobacterales bacterium]
MGHKPDLIAIAQDVVASTLDALPATIARQVAQVSVFVESLPNAEDRSLGVGEDWLGIFEGASYSHGDLPDPPRIRIWVENLWSFAGGRETYFREEVRITLLHEIGHYLGLDEEQVALRGLE